VAVARVVGAGLLVAIGLIHLSLAPTYILVATYIGILFYVTCAVAWLSALAILVGVRGAWLVDALLSAGTMSGLVLASTTGLPAFMDSLSAPLATLSLALEGGFLALYASAAIARRSPVLSGRR